MERDFIASTFLLERQMIELKGIIAGLFEAQFEFGLIRMKFYFFDHHYDDFGKCSDTQF